MTEGYKWSENTIPHLQKTHEHSDGSQHYEKEGLLKDKIRTELIETRGLTVIRIPNNEVMKNFSGVCEYIDTVVKESLHR